MLKVIVLAVVLAAAAEYVYRRYFAKAKAEVVAVESKVSSDVAAVKADVASVEKKVSTDVAAVKAEASKL